MLRRIRFETILTATFAAGLVWFVITDVRDRNSKQRAYEVVSKLGGRVGSLPCWPFGDEIAITFENSKFSKEELDWLVVLKPLIPKNSVKLFLRDTSLSKEDVTKLRQMLPNIAITRIVGSQQMDDG